MTSDQNLVSVSSEGRMPGFEGTTGWLNSAPLTASGLRGRVTLVNFWTYTCINWLRQLPYLRAWTETYEPHGLSIVGVHTPEFGFERTLDNVERAVREMGIHYPVALDNDYSVWSAFANRYWPALYFVDRDGRIRHHHFGEGGYEQSERIIRKLLEVEHLPETIHSPVKAKALEVQADWASLRSSESYLGYARSTHFASPGGTDRGRRHEYTPPVRLPLNHWALSGAWTVTNEAATLSQPPGSVITRFHARDLHLVMGPTDGCDTIRFRVEVDDAPPGDAQGVDVDAEGYGVATHQRLYQLVRQPGPITDRTFKITFLDPDVQVFAFTFG